MSQRATQIKSLTGEARKLCAFELREIEDLAQVLATRLEDLALMVPAMPEGIADLGGRTAESLRTATKNIQAIRERFEQGPPIKAPPAPAWPPAQISLS